MTEAPPWETLFAAAESARLRAYAPYSRFFVGAAVWGDDGRIYAGCNVENASYGLCLCAERNAVGRLVAEGGKRVRAVAVVVASRTPTPPCGMCRQVLAELASAETPVRSRTCDGQELVGTVGEFLPNAFTSANL